MQIHSLGGALTVTFIVCAILFVFLETGYRLGRHLRQKSAHHDGTSVVEGATLGLLGLMLSFSLAQSKDGFTARKQLVVDTVNAMTTAYDRTALLPAVTRESVRHLMSDYVNEVAASGEQGSDRDQRADPHRKRAVSLHHEIWNESVAGCANDDSCKQILLPALNKMSETAFTHLALTQSHKPWGLLAFLITLASFGAVLAGYALAVYGTRPWVHGTLYIFSIAVSLYMIIDVEFPLNWGVVQIQTRSVALEEIAARFIP